MHVSFSLVMTWVMRFIIYLIMLVLLWECSIRLWPPNFTIPMQVENRVYYMVQKELWVVASPYKSEVLGRVLYRESVSTHALHKGFSASTAIGECHPLYLPSYIQLVSRKKIQLPSCSILSERTYTPKNCHELRAKEIREYRHHMSRAWHLPISWERVDVDNS